jgi:hypothetical protein
MMKLTAPMNVTVFLHPRTETWIGFDRCAIRLFHTRAKRSSNRSTRTFSGKRLTCARCISAVTAGKRGCTLFTGKDSHTCCGLLLLLQLCGFMTIYNLCPFAIYRDIC